MNTEVSKKIFSTIISVLLVGGLCTVFLSLVKMEVPPVVNVELSLWDMVKSIPDMGGGDGGEKKIDKDSSGLEIDYMDVIQKILPKKAGSGEPTKVSLTFLHSVLVPISILLSYIFLIIALITFWIEKKTVFSASVIGSFITSLYATFGVLLLGKAATDAFENTVSEKAGGLLGAITKHFVKEISIEPEKALYILCVCTFVAFVISLLGKTFLKK